MSGPQSWHDPGQDREGGGRRAERTDYATGRPSTGGGRG